MDLYLYADNWQLKGNSVNATSEAFKALKSFTDISRLHMANAKCWFWATTPMARKALRKISDQHDHGELQVKTGERDLGVGASYNKNKNKRVLQVREAVTAPQLDRIRRMPCSEQAKVHLTSTSPVPRLLFGCQSTPVSDTWITYWRRRIARAAFPY